MELLSRLRISYEERCSKGFHPSSNLRKTREQFEKAKNNPESLNIEDAASYLEKLARRVPPA
jgi:hypothetical protein